MKKQFDKLHFSTMFGVFLIAIIFTSNAWAVPTVTGQSSSPGEVGIEFSTAMDPASVEESFTLKVVLEGIGFGTVAGQMEVGDDGTTAKFVPFSGLISGLTYEVSFEGAKDTAGNPLQFDKWSFNSLRYKTGQWITHPTGDGITLIDKALTLMDSEPVVTMTDDWTALVEFTTAIPVPAATIYYGVYDPDSILPWPRFYHPVSEELEGDSIEHSVELDLGRLKRDKADIANLAEKGGGVVVYRIEIYSPGSRFNEPAAARFYDRRFEFYNGMRVPTVIEGPFVDQITETGAVISWDTDMPVEGTVEVTDVDDFPGTGTATHFEVELSGLVPGNTYEYSVKITGGSKDTSQYFFRTPAENTTQFSFAVMGDSRSGLGGGEYDFNGVNAFVVRNLATGALKKGAEFIVHTGDLINGYTDSPLDFKMQLESYKDAVENVGHYIPMYEMMGNHEVVVTAYLTDDPAVSYGLLQLTKEGDESAEAIFGNEFVNPVNGPDPDNNAAGAPGGKSLPPYKENVYYFDYGNCRFVVMNNNYWYSGLPETYGGNLEGYILDDQLEWVLDLFSQAKDDDSVEHLFLFAQEPLFPVGWQSHTGMWYNGGDPEMNSGFDRTYVVERRDMLWQAFVGTGKAVAGNFGDEHNYSRTFITKDGKGNNYERPAWQIVSGGAGAPFASLETGLPWSDGVEKSTAQMHYTLMRVDGKEVRLEVYNINNRLIESVVLKTDEGTISSNAPEVEPIESSSEFLSDLLGPVDLESGGYIGPTDPLGIPADYKTGQWISYPAEDGDTTIIEKNIILLNSEPQVTMTDDWTALVEFTTAIPTRSATIYYGVYDPDSMLPWPRFRQLVSEELEEESTEHSIELDIGYLKRPKIDITNMEENDGGVIVYRIEIYSPEIPMAKPAAVRFYDRHFKLYKGRLVPVVTEGPFVDQITETSAVISWDTDRPVEGTVVVEGEGDFPGTGTASHFEVELSGLAPGNTYNYSVQITDGEDTTTTRQYFFRTPAEDATQFTFAVMGDSRSGLGGGEYDFNGVNALVVRSLATDALNKGAEFIVHTGDLIDGYTDSPLDFKMQLASYKDAVENVGHYIPMYEMMGNHEAVVKAYLTDDPAVSYGMLQLTREGDESAEAIFGNQFVNPVNGPEPDNEAADTPEGKSLPPYRENVYYFDYGNCRFVVMNNNYWYSGLPENYGGNLEGYILDDQLEWVLDVFSQAKDDDSVEHLFLFAQEPLFPVGWQSHTGMWYNGGDPEDNKGFDRTYVPERRDVLWQAFVSTGKAVAGNFGDEHNYSRTFITKDRNGNDFERPAWQLVSGGAGAPFAAKEAGMPWSDGMRTSTAQMHYTLMKVNGSIVMLEVYNIDGILIDIVELTKDIK
ncbi:MAG: hypothetical protein GY761_19085 [Hyphomicrobiales bacterium]|nr:hypothetical protein [Hyphomicrobiales bacterium]